MEAVAEFELSLEELRTSRALASPVAKTKKIKEANTTARQAELSNKLNLMISLDQLIPELRNS
jgi:hypothetical protein